MTAMRTSLESVRRVPDKDVFFWTRQVVSAGAPLKMRQSHCWRPQTQPNSPVGAADFEDEGEDW